jgi:FkbM family methyltransferase
MQAVTARPAVFRGRERVLKIEDSGEYNVLTLAGFDRPLYCPKDTDLNQLFMVLTELLDPTDWHYYEVPETTVAADDVVVDCGAAEGLFSLRVAPRCKQVLAIEPVPKFVAAMRKTFADVPNVEIVPFGISDKPGRSRIEMQGFSSVVDGVTSGEEIELTTLDALVAERNIPVTYLKADLEGFEMKMLEGARQTIAGNLPKIAITTYHRAGDAAAITSFLTNISPKYRFRTKGLEYQWGEPIMLHAWIE